jgi:hypothetical protein
VVYCNKLYYDKLSSNGGARTAACLQLVLVYIVIARWPKALFVIFIDFLGFLVLLWNMDNYQ